MTGDTSEIPSQEAAPFSFTMEVEEDIEQEIETFVRFKRRGEYEKAEEMFQQTLSEHLSLFPVIAEYADLLLVQGQYRILSEFLDIQIQYMEPVLEEEELELLRIMKSLVHIYTQGSLRPALIQASHTWNFLHRRSTNLPLGTLPGDVEVGVICPTGSRGFCSHTTCQQIHIFEIYINIIVFALVTSNWVGPDEMKCPWALDKHSDHSGFMQWYLALSCNGHIWSASQVLLILLQALPLFHAHDAAALFDKNCFGRVASEQSLWNLSEMDQLIACSTSFSRAQALLNLALILYQVDAYDNKWKELYELALSYSHIADFLPRIIHHDNNVSLIDMRAYVQRTQFQRVREAIIKPKLLPTSLSPNHAFDHFTEALFQQDPRCYIICYFQSLLAHAQGLSNHHPGLIDLASLSDWQLHNKGNLTGFIHTWELCCTLMNNFVRNRESQPEKTILSSQADSFLAEFRSTEKTTQLQQSMTGLAKELWHQIQRIISKESPGLNFEQSVELILSCGDTPKRLDIPLYLWTMHSKLGILDLKLRDTPTLTRKLMFSDSSLQIIKSNLPKPASRMWLGEIANLVLGASQSGLSAPPPQHVYPTQVLASDDRDNDGTTYEPGGITMPNDFSSVDDGDMNAGLTWDSYFAESVHPLPGFNDSHRKRVTTRSTAEELATEEPSPSRRRRSSSGVNRSAHRVEDEEPPESLFYERRIQEALNNARNIIGRVARVLSGSNMHREQGSSVQTIYQQAARLSTFEPSSCRIVGLVGDSGVGKSSLINSLLDKMEFARAVSPTESSLVATN